MNFEPEIQQNAFLYQLIIAYYTLNEDNLLKHKLPAKKKSNFTESRVIFQTNISFQRMLLSHFNLGGKRCKKQKKSNKNKMEGKRKKEEKSV